MKLVSFGPPHEERAGVIQGDDIVDLHASDPSLPLDVLQLLEQDRLDEAAAVAQRVGGARVPLAGTRLGPPVTRPSKIICLGLNYRDHAAEQGKKLPGFPLLFSKGPNALSGHGDTVPYPRGVEQFDFEVELAFVIGKRGKHIPRDAAWEHVAGYAVFLDLTARDLQYSERQWFRGKSVDGSAPFGPFLATRDEVPDPHDLDIALSVNGETMQSSRTGEMEFTVDFLVNHISQTMTLEPGDIVATGTPPGVGVHRKPPRFLVPGDELRARIDGLGELMVSIGERE